MILQIQGHSDDIVELLNDRYGDDQLDLCGGEGMAVIRVGMTDTTQMVITVQHHGTMGFVFTLSLDGNQCHAAGCVLPGRIDVEVSGQGDGPRWVIDVPDGTYVHTTVLDRAHQLVSAV